MNNGYNPWNTPGYNYPQYPYSISQQTNPQMPNNVNAPRVNTISGRVVSSPNEITPNEIPMDGSVSLFPTNDYSAIYAKAWNANGQIETVKFVVSKPEEVTTEKSDIGIKAALDAINARLDKIEAVSYRKDKRYYNKNTQSKKEVTSNE